MSKFLCATLLSFAVSIAPQETGSGQKPPPLPPPLPAKEAASGGPSPGVLPPTTSPDAAAAWDAVSKASLAPGSERSAVHAFELALAVRARNSSGGTNDFKAEFRFLEPSWVRVKTVESKKEVGRGPDGDWLFDEARDERIKLSIGREYAEDRRQLDD